MKKNFYYLSLLLGLFFGMTMFTACGGDDDDNGGSGPTTGGGGGEEGYEPGKFYGPKRVFGDNLLSSFGGTSGGSELTYNSDDFVTSIKPYSIDANGQKNYSGYDYEISYSDNQVIVNHRVPSGTVKQYTFTIGNNGFAESYISKPLNGGSGKTALVKFEYDKDGHLTKLTANEEGHDNSFIGTCTWQNGNMIESSSDDGAYRTYTVSYNSTPNITGLYVHASLGGDMGEFYMDEFYYIGLFGKGTANLVQSYSRSSSSKTADNAWTLDGAGRPTKCVTTTTSISGSSSSTSTSTYFWNYR